MKTLAILLSCALSWALATPIMAQKTLSPAEFEAYVTGKTLYFGQAGKAYGVEQYLKNRKVRWSFLDGNCKDGRWYVETDLICFVYEDNPTPQCWSFELTTKGLKAEYQSKPGVGTLYEVNETSEPMECLGPKIGV